MGRTLLVERAESCKKNQLANQNNIPRNIYFSDFSNSGLLVRYLRLSAFDELIKHL